MIANHIIHVDGVFMMFFLMMIYACYGVYLTKLLAFVWFQMHIPGVFYITCI